MEPSGPQSGVGSCVWIQFPAFGQVPFAANGLFTLPFVVIISDLLLIVSKINTTWLIPRVLRTGGVFTADQFPGNHSSLVQGALNPGSSFLIHKEMEKGAMHLPPGSRRRITSLLVK